MSLFLARVLMIEGNVPLGGMIALSMKCVFLCLFFPYSQNQHVLQRPHLLPSTNHFNMTQTVTVEILASSLMPRTFKERDIPCTICGREFTNRAGLTNHQRVHRKPILKKVNPSQPASQTATPSRSPSIHSFGQPDDAGIQALPEDRPLPQTRCGPHESETVTYHPLINGMLDFTINNLNFF